jgi:hypothetical protein
MNAALWLALGTAAGVIVGVSLADRSGGRKLIRRITGALGMFESLTGQFDKLTGRAVPAGKVRADDDDLDEDDEDLDDEFESVHDEAVSPAYAVGDDEDDFDATEDEGSGFEPDTDSDCIDERVLAAFEQDPILAERDIEIDEPEPAVIALAGRVSSDEDARHAVTIARGVPGVERVENYIRIRNRPPVSPPPEESDV